MIQKTAKEIFWEYSCNHFFLDREGMLEEYIKQGGNDPDDEKKWRTEYIEFWFNQIPNNEIVAFRNLVYSEALEILDPFISYNVFRDDYIKFWYAFELLELAKLTSNTILKNKTKLRAKEIFIELINKKIFLLDENKREIDRKMMETFNAKTKEDYIKNYSKRILQKIRLTKTK